MRFTLSIDGRKIGDGTLLVNSEGQARFCAGDGEDGSLLLAVLEDAVLEAVASNGLAINGHELGGRRRGEVKRRAVTWWLTPVEDKE